MHTYLVNGFDELRATDALRIVHVESQEVLPQQLTPVRPGEAAAEGLHRARQLLVRVAMVVEHLWFDSVRVESRRGKIRKCIKR